MLAAKAAPATPEGQEPRAFELEKYEYASEKTLDIIKDKPKSGAIILGIVRLADGDIGGISVATANVSNEEALAIFALATAQVCAEITGSR